MDGSSGNLNEKANHKCRCHTGHPGSGSFYGDSLCQVIFQKKYETLVGEVTLIQNCKGRKRYWEIEVVDGEGRVKQLLISVQSGVRKGIVYRFFLKNDILLGLEEM